MNSKAFTLLEILLVSVMMGILALVVGPILSTSIQSTTIIGSRRQAVGEARAAIERMVKEIRLIPNTSVLANLSPSNFQFQYPAGTSITYSLSGTNLMRNANILASDITSLTFTYYDESGASTSTAANVRSVGIQLSILSTDDNTTLTLRTRVFLRNTGHNYGNYSTS